MASLDWSLCPPVESIPGKFRGASLFKGTCTSVAIVIRRRERPAGHIVEEAHVFFRARVEREALQPRGDGVAVFGLRAFDGRSAVHRRALATHALASDCARSHCLGICT